MEADEAAAAADDMEDKSDEAKDKDGDAPMSTQPISEGNDLTMEDVFSLDAMDALEVFQFDELYDWEDLERELEVEHGLIDKGTDESMTMAGRT